MEVFATLAFRTTTHPKADFFSLQILPEHTLQDAAQWRAPERRTRLPAARSSDWPDAYSETNVKMYKFQITKTSSPTPQP